MILYPENPVLIVDDEKSESDSNEAVLKSAGINHILTCRDSREVLPILAGREIECILLDITLPNFGCKELLPEIREQFPEVPVIIVTGVDEVGTAVVCMKNGAWHYMVKPVDKNDLESHVKQLIQMNSMKRRYTQLHRRFFSDELENPGAFKEIITADAGMKAIFQYIEVIAPSPEPVLITGETGVGKELIARAIHTLSRRKGKYVVVNAAGVDDNVFSDTLFGHERGAYTDAVRSRAGMVQTAAGGTLFLDEIGDLSPASQVKLLRLLQEGEYYPLGSDNPRYGDARLILATNSDLKAMMEANHFRKDLYHRVSVHRVQVPPLRRRLDDIPLLLDHFLDEAAEKLHKKKPTVPIELYPLLKTYRFPGNIRELRTMVMEAVSSQKSPVLALKSFRETISRKADQPSHMSAGERSKREAQDLVTFSSSLPTLAQVEHILIEEALARSGGNQTLAAHVLGISRQALNNRLHRKTSRLR